MRFDLAAEYGLSIRMFVKWLRSLHVSHGMVRPVPQVPSRFILVGATNTWYGHALRAGLTVSVVVKSFVRRLTTLVDLVIIPTRDSSLIILDLTRFLQFLHKTNKVEDLHMGIDYHLLVGVGRYLMHIVTKYPDLDGDNMVPFMIHKHPTQEARY
jgi:hypothetical protein